MIALDHLFESLMNPITLGVLLGLCIGKPLGIFSFTWLALQLRLGDLPDGADFRHILGVGTLAGIGFTMSIFIAELAFAGQDAAIASVKMGILFASVLSGLVGALALFFTSSRSDADTAMAC
jgi:NhaA family Na+:H+ antiporter